MSDFPGTSPILLPIISTEGMFGMGGVMMGSSLGITTSTWPSNNLAVFSPFSIPSPFVVRSMFWINGGTTSGTVDAGIYGLDASLILSTGSVSQSGASTFQVTAVTEKLLSPGAYYFAMSCSNTTATFQRHTYSDEQLAGLLRVGTLHPLTTLPTLAIATNDYQPICGVSSRASF